MNNQYKFSSFNFLSFIFLICPAVSVFYESFLFDQTEAALVPYTIMTVSAVLGWIVIIPYYYYVKIALIYKNLVTAEN